MSTATRNNILESWLPNSSPVCWYAQILSTSVLSRLYTWRFPPLPFVPDWRVPIASRTVVHGSELGLFGLRAQNLIGQEALRYLGRITAGESKQEKRCVFLAGTTDWENRTGKMVGASCWWVGIGPMAVVSHRRNNRIWRVSAGGGAVYASWTSSSSMPYKTQTIRDCRKCPRGCRRTGALDRAPEQVPNETFGRAKYWFSILGSDVCSSSFGCRFDDCHHEPEDGINWKSIDREQAAPILIISTCSSDEVVDKFRARQAYLFYLFFAQRKQVDHARLAPDEQVMQIQNLLGFESRWPPSLSKSVMVIRNLQFKWSPIG